jgi:plasmid stabilization system protein ParE
MRYRLRIAADVWIQAGAIDAWWRANRAASPTLFREELEAALERLEQAPFASAIYGHEGQPSTLRRLLLPRCRYFVYFEIEDDEVSVLAVWHASRGTGPAL